MFLQLNVLIYSQVKKYSVLNLMQKKQGRNREVLLSLCTSLMGSQPPIFSNSNTLLMASWYCCLTQVAVLKDRELLMNQDFKHEETLRLKCEKHKGR